MIFDVIGVGLSRSVDCAFAALANTISARKETLERITFGDSSISKLSFQDIDVQLHQRRI